VKNAKKPMFERMMMLENEEIKPQREDIDIDLIWGVIESGNHHPDLDSYITKNTSLNDYYHKILNLDQNYCEDDDSEVYIPSTNLTSVCDANWCHEKFVALFKEYEIIKLQRNSMDLTIASVFYVALAVGLIFGSVIMYGLSFLRKKLFLKNSRKQRMMTNRHICK
jgi:hypothetical protein